MIDLEEFLLARIAEDEAAARDSGPLSPGAVFDHDVSGWWKADRVLAECGAKRWIVEHGRGYLDAAKSEPPRSHMNVISHAYVDVMIVIAQPYRDHPDFDPAWAIVEFDAMPRGKYGPTADYGA
jgi:hypothetical protein